MTTDERLAALEAKMDALTAPPSDYYTSRYSGEEIDVAIAAVPGKAETAQLCNRNLLDNWYFGNPVNQRGQTEYTGSGHTIDRWKALTDVVTLTISNDGITLRRNGGNPWLLSEQIEPSIVTNFMGKHFTVSVLTTQGLVVLDVPSAFTSETSVVDPTGVSVWLNTSGIVLIGTTNDSMTPIAAKLELGSQQTLAHQDADGNWVLNEIPDYGEQLRRCQRYFYRLKSQNGNNYGVLALGYLQSNAQGHFLVNFPNTMRTVPTYSMSGALQIYSKSTGYAVTSLSHQSFNGNALLLVANCAANENFAVGNTAHLSSMNDATAYIDFSADL